MTDNLNNEFRCEKLKKKLSYARCLRNQREALEFWGPEAAKFQSCPCPQGVEKADAEPIAAVIIKIEEGKDIMNTKAKTCKNCDFVGPSKGLDFCFRCYDVQHNAKKAGRDVDEALRKAKIRRIEGTRIRMTPGGKVLKKIDKSLPWHVRKNEEKMPVDSLLPLAPISTNCVLVFFNDNDLKILEGLRTLAKRHRREPDQQILHMLQEVIHG